MEIIRRGAEALLYMENSKLVKKRAKKGYRIPQLDDHLRKGRTKAEARLIREAARAGIPVPRIYHEEGPKLVMEFINGKVLKELIHESRGIREIGKTMGRVIGKLHSVGIIHGDLTTSNMIWKEGEIWLIDFGLGFFSRRAEDFGTDLAVLHEAIRSTHFKHLNSLWSNIIEEYKAENPQWEKVLKALENIESRGRYVRRK